MFKDIFGGSPETKILDFLADNPDRDYSISEIAKHAQTSRPTVYKMKDLFLKKGLMVQTRNQGNSQMFKLNIDNPLVQLILKFDFEIAESIECFISQESVKKYSSKIFKSNKNASKNKTVMSHLRIR